MAREGINFFRFRTSNEGQVGQEDIACRHLEKGRKALLADSVTTGPHLKIRVTRLFVVRKTVEAGTGARGNRRTRRKWSTKSRNRL